MTPSPIAIDPHRFVDADEVKSIIARTMVLCPTREYPSKPTEALIRELMDLGAMVHLTSGVSDIALARSMTAGVAYEKLDASREGVDTVFWLDDDMTASPAHIAALCSLSLSLGSAVCGYYCMRSNQAKITTKVLVGDIASVTLDDGTDVPLYPAWSGLGCLALPSYRFLEACDAGPWCDMLGQRFPAIFQARALEGGDGQFHWVSEDIFFCQHLWKSAGGLYLAPIEFGHLTTGEVRPLPTARFLDESPTP